MTVTLTLGSGERITARPTAADMMRYELAAHREKWPTPAPFLQSAFTAWSAARRAGAQLPAKFAQFFDELADLEIESDEEPETPTSPATTPEQ